MVLVWPDVITFFTCLSQSGCIQALMILVLLPSHQPSHPLSSDPPTLPPAHAPRIRTPTQSRLLAVGKHEENACFTSSPLAGGSTVVAVASRPL
jgi:hypothetical protein